MRSNVEWKEWGKTDPLYGVVSFEGRNKRGPNPWTEDEFYAYGQRQWPEYARQWERYGINRACCLEIGCGAGRITRQLASYFDTVEAVDVSEDMLRCAKRAVDLPAAHFSLCDGQSLPLPDRSVTAVFSCDVFQHFDRTSQAEAYFREIYRVCDSRSTIMIHLPVYTWPRGRTVFNFLYAVRRSIDRLSAEAKRSLIKLGVGRPFMHGIGYESDWLFRTLSAIGFSEIEIRWFGTSAEGDRTSFRSHLFALKA